MVRENEQSLVQCSTFSLESAGQVLPPSTDRIMIVAEVRQEEASEEDEVDGRGGKGRGMGDKRRKRKGNGGCTETADSSTFSLCIMCGHLSIGLV